MVIKDLSTKDPYTLIQTPINSIHRKVEKRSFIGRVRTTNYFNI